MFSVEAQDLITEMEEKKESKDHSLTVPFLAPLFSLSSAKQVCLSRQTD